MDERNSLQRVWLGAVMQRLQWRDRTGFPPASFAGNARFHRRAHRPSQCGRDGGNGDWLKIVRKFLGVAF
ncbi:hypothetical protein CFR73_10625 [Novacetimonas maltaceti]|nr:hypothetical protein CFR73_10625 [Novacetimonas maltaceti]